uniref:Uncharacterized protein n=1 Tax=uncultured marine virus TaxID=186617 RepID=A0A0F7LAX2_9VIRU|nr:hypothetical protein [uncultured marine virus]
MSSRVTPPAAELSAAFGTQRSQVQILSSRLQHFLNNDIESRIMEQCHSCKVQCDFGLTYAKRWRDSAYRSAHSRLNSRRLSRISTRFCKAKHNRHSN